jgi:glycerol-3-phosphate dehydrogenase subunit C
MDQASEKHIGGCRETCGGNGCRPAVDWRGPTYLDEQAINAELQRVFGICADCRICENFCDSFPRLFALIDQSPDQDIRNVSPASYKSVVDACTLCDMCYPVCPYRPPHDYAVAFPDLMVRYRALEKKQGEIGLADNQLGKIDRNGRLARTVAPLVNWATKRENRISRVTIEKLAGIHRDAWLPRYQAHPPVVEQLDRKRSNSGQRKVVIYHNCLVEYNNSAIGKAAMSALSRNGIDAQLAYPGCCGMPFMERGDIDAACAQAEIVSRELSNWMDDEYDVISLIPSCTFMLKTIWPMYLPDDPLVARLAKNTFDICEYIVALAHTDGLAEGLNPLPGGVALHVPCHTRSQEIGPQSAVMLRMIPETDVLVIEQCSGHGGTWGVMKQNFEVGMKIGAPLAQIVATSGRRYLSSECPLAGEQIIQAIESISASSKPVAKNYHPIEILAMSYGGEQTHDRAG